MDRIMIFNVPRTLKMATLFSFQRAGRFYFKPACVLFSLFYVSQVSALSAVSAKTIRGNAPALSFDGGNSAASNLDGFLTVTLPDGTVLSPSNSTAPILEPIYGFQQFLTTVAADGSAKPIPANYYFDSDKDTPDSITPINGTLTAVWTDRDGNTITNLNEQLNLCHQPYTLTITADNVSVNSQYGDPITSNYGTQSQSYVVNLSGYKLCYLKPITTGTNREWVKWSGVMIQWNKPNGVIPDPSSGGGITDDYIINKGFLADPVVSVNRFPTTGFNNAKFQMVMSNGQSPYNFSVQATPAGSVTIDSTTGDVTLVNKPKGPVTLTATPISGEPPINYTFDINLWAYLPQLGLPVNMADAITYCNGAENLLTRAELSSSPHNNKPQGWSYTANYFTRSIDGSLSGEWGYLSGYDNWQSDYYWTKEAQTTGEFQFVVNPSNGNISYVESDDFSMLVCRDNN